MFLFIILLFNLNADIKRISKINFDKTEVGKIYMKTGLITKIKFPCSVDEINVGRKKDLKIEFSPNTSDTINISFTRKNHIPTNLIVNCNKTTMIFDVIPSNYHQDLVEISNINGFLSPYKVIKSSAINKNKNVKKQMLKKELIVSNKLNKNVNKSEIITSKQISKKTLKKQLIESSEND